MQKVEGSSPFIRFRIKRFRARTHGLRAPAVPQTLYVIQTEATFPAV